MLPRPKAAEPIADEHPIQPDGATSGDSAVWGEGVSCLGNLGA